MLVKEKRRRISPSPHMANYIKQIIFAFLGVDEIRSLSAVWNQHEMLNVINPKEDTR